MERPPRRRVDAVRVARLGEEAARARQVDLAKRVRVAGIVAEETGRDRRLGGDAAAVLEHARELARVDDEAHRLPELPAALARGRADDRVLHVEAQVEHRRDHRLLELHPERGHVGRQRARLHDAIEALLDDAGLVVVALEELRERGHVFLVETKLDALEERQRLADVGGIEERALAVVGLALARIDGGGCLPLGMTDAVPAWVALEHHAAPLVVLRKTERPRADRMLVEELAPLATVVRDDRLPRDRRRELHREPEEDLRIGLVELDLDRRRVEDAHARNAAGGAILLVDAPRGERGVVLPCGGEPCGEFREVDDVRERAADRAVDLRVADAHEREGDVVGRHLAGRAARAAEREARVVGELDVVAQLEAVCHVAAGARLRRRHGARETRDQSIGPLEQMVLEQLVVDGTRHDMVGGRVGDLRVERLRRLAERQVEHLPVLVVPRIRVVPARDDDHAGHEGQHRSPPHERLE